VFPSRAGALAFVLVLLAGSLAGMPIVSEPTASPAKFAPQHLISPEPGSVASAQPRVVSPATPPVPPQSAVVGTERLLVIPIEFTDVAHNGANTPQSITSFFNAASGTSVNAYYREASAGQLSIDATVTNWVLSTRTLAAYGADSTGGVDDFNGPIYRLTTEAVRLADPVVDFRTFDTDGDGTVNHVVIVHAGAAQESSGNVNDIWSHRWVVVDANPGGLNDPLTVDGVQVYGYIMTAEDSPIGVVSHELGHDFGLPDLYDTDGSSEGGVGEWDIMATGSWNGIPRGTSPAHFSAWCRAFLGWETPVEVTSPILPATIVTGSSFRLPVRTDAAGDEYFLVENRQQSGFDAALPGRGLLIWHADDSIGTNDADARRLVDLEEADEASGENPTQPGDAWANSPTGWGPFTVPSSDGYGNVPSGWKVRNIGPAGASMLADLAKEVADDLAVARIVHPTVAAPGQPVAITVEVGDLGVRPQQPPATVTFAIHRDTFAPGSVLSGFPRTASTPVLTPGASANLTWSFAPAAEGRYILRAGVALAGDEIPENNERLVAFSVHNVAFYADLEAGGTGWTTNGASNDTFRWSIVDDAMPDGASHSPTHAWRFGYRTVTLPNLPNPLPPRFHTLTSPAITISTGPLYLALYQRYDLTGAVANPGQTDDGWIQVSFNSGPWTTVGQVSGRNLDWSVFSADLGALAAGATTMRVRLNATSDVMRTDGGWWVDDVLVTRTPLARAVAVLPVIPDRSIEPGATGTFIVKAVNIGDLDDRYDFRATLPAGWTARIGGNSSAPVVLPGFTVPLAPNAEATLQLHLTSPAGVVRGTVVTVPLVVTSTNDASAAATFNATARISDPLGFGTLTRYAPYLIGLLVVLMVIVLLINSRKRRKFRGAIR